MKRKSILTHFWKAVLGIAFVHGLTSEAYSQGTTTISRPGNSQYYEHDGSNWIHLTNKTYTYNSNGWLTSELNADPVTNQNLNKTEYILDAFDKVNTITGSLWQNNAWIVGDVTKFIRTYNTANKVTELIFQITKNGTLVNERKTNYTYDAAGNTTEELTSVWRNNAWEFNDKNIFTNVNGVRTERITYIYNKSNATWVPTRKLIYAGWHVPNLYHTSLIAQQQDAGGNWVNLSRSTITIGPNGNREEIEEVNQNNTWIFSTRTNYTYDTQGNITDFLFEEYVNNAWRMVWIDKQIFTYSPQNDMLEMIYQGQDSTYGPLKNQFKEVYSNFQYFPRTLGTPEMQKSQLSVNVFPNPATDNIQIEPADLKTTITVTISDITGKTWLTKTFKVEEARQLNIEALPKGVYLIQLQSEAGSITKRIVKQ